MFLALLLKLEAKFDGLPACSSRLRWVIFSAGNRVLD